MAVAAKIIPCLWFDSEAKHGGKAAALCLFLNGTFLNGTFVPCGDGAMGGDG